jgi:RNA polymerase sigma factor (sigma-70 family)
MRRPDPHAFFAQIHRLATDPLPDDCPDVVLLERFARRGEEGAFTALVRRHGPMVLGVCRRVLGNLPDAEDAFQAAFLVLARKAGSVRRSEALGGWLHRVARRLAVKARTRRDRRRVVEGPASGRTRNRGLEADAAGRAEGREPPEELSLREALAILDEEVGRLPNKFRLPVVLCYLQGKTNEEAAREVGCPSGTLKGRLLRARELLAARLTRRGVTLAAGAVSVLLAGGAVAGPPGAWTRTAVAAALAFVGRNAGGGAGSAEAVGMAESLMREMTMGWVKAWACGLLVLAVLGAGTGLLVQQTLPAEEPPAARAKLPAEAPRARADFHGDPLPAGAMARLGTVRWRHGGLVAALAFADGGKEVVTAGPDGCVRVWDAATGKQLRRLGEERPADPDFDTLLRPAAITADGRVAALVARDGLHVWDVVAGKELRRIALRNGTCPALALAPDGKKLLVVDADRKPVLWDVASGKPVGRLEMPAQPPGADPALRDNWLYEPRQPVFSTDGKRIAVICDATAVREEAVVKLWDAVTGKELREIIAPAGPPADDPLPAAMPAFSADGKVLAWATPGSILRLVDPATDKQILTIPLGKEAWPVCMAFSSDGKRLAALTADDRVRLYDARSGKEERAAGKQGAGGNNYLAGAAVLAFSPDGKTLARAYGGNAVRFWDADTGAPGTALQVREGPAGHDGAIMEIAVSADGRTVTTSGADQTFRRWDPATGKELARVVQPEMVLPNVGRASTLSPDGQTLAVVRLGDGFLRLWDVPGGKEVRRIKPPTGADGIRIDDEELHLLQFAPDGKFLAWADEHHALLVYDVATGKLLGRLGPPPDELDPQTNGSLVGITVAPGGRTVLTFTDHAILDAAPLAGAAPLPEKLTCRVRVWDVASGSVVRTWDAPGGLGGASFATLHTHPDRGESPGTFGGAALAPDGRSLALATTERAGLWELATGKERLRYPRGIALLQPSPDGRFMAAAGGSVVRLLDARTGKELGRLAGHQAAVETLAFTPDAKALVTGSADSTALVWDIASLAAAAPAPGAGELDALWDDLAGDDAAKAYRAVVGLGCTPEQAVELLKRRLKPAVGPDPKQVGRWVAELDDESFTVRQKAAQELEALGDAAVPVLKEVLQGTPTAEVRRRGEQILSRLEPARVLSGSALREVRAVEVLEAVGTDDARALLRALAGGARGTRLTEEARTALARRGG